MRVLTKEERATELDFMTNSKEWPIKPILPVKRSQPKGWPELGVMVEHIPGVIFLKVDIYDPNVSFNPLTHKHRIVYNTIEAMIDDGWVVD